MSLSPQQASSLLKLVGLSDQNKNDPNEDPNTHTDLLDRLVRKIHMDLLEQKDEYRAQRRHLWPRVMYRADDIQLLIGKPLLTVAETKLVVERLRKLNVSVVCPCPDLLVATMKVVPQVTPANTRNKRRHKRK